MKKRYLTIGDFKRNAFIVAAAATLGLTSCESNTKNEGEWNAGTEAAAPDGIITEVTEQEPDQWIITDERTTAPGQNMAILQRGNDRPELCGAILEQCCR